MLEVEGRDVCYGMIGIAGIERALKGLYVGRKLFVNCSRTCY
jgi:hypothetical protein